MGRMRIRSVAIVTAALFLAGCGSNTPQAQQMPEAVPSGEDTTVAATPGATTTTVAPTTSEPAASATQPSTPTPALVEPGAALADDGYAEEFSSSVSLRAATGLQAVVSVRSHFTVENDAARTLISQECGARLPEDSHAIAKMVRVSVQYDDPEGSSSNRPDLASAGRIWWGLWHTEQGGSPAVQRAFVECKSDEWLPSLQDVLQGNDERVFTVYTVIPRTPENPNAEVPDAVVDEWKMISLLLVRSNDFAYGQGTSWSTVPSPSGATWSDLNPIHGPLALELRLSWLPTTERPTS